MTFYRLPAGLPVDTFIATRWSPEKRLALWAVDDVSNYLKLLVDASGDVRSNARLVEYNAGWVKDCEFLLFRPGTDGHVVVSALLTLAGGPRVLEFLRQAFTDARKTDDAYVLRTD